MRTLQTMFVAVLLLVGWALPGQAQNCSTLDQDTSNGMFWQITRPTCPGDSNGSITLWAKDPVSGMRASGQHEFIVVSDTGVAIIDAQDSFLTLNNLRAGRYQFRVRERFNQCNYLPTGQGVTVQLDTFGVGSVVNFATQEAGIFDTTRSLNIACANGQLDQLTVLTQGGSGSFQYYWIHPNNSDTDTTTSPSLTSLGTAGTWTVIVDDNNGCFNFQDSFTLGLAPSNVSLTNVDVLRAECNGDATGAARVSITGGYGQYVVQWTLGGSSVQDTILNSNPADTIQVTRSDLTASTPGNDWEVTVFDLTLDNQYVCTANAPSDVFSIQNSQIEIVDSLLAFNPTTCAGGSDARLDATGAVVNGIPPYTYSWFQVDLANNDSVQLPETSAILSGLSGDSTYTLLVQDANGCERARQFTVPTTDSVDFTVSSPNQAWNNSCAPGGQLEVDIDPNTVTTPYDIFLLTPGGLGVDTLSNVVTDINSFTNLPGGMDYTVRIVDANGCANERSLDSVNYPMVYGPADTLVFDTLNWSDSVCNHLQVRNIRGGYPMNGVTGEQGYRVQVFDINNTLRIDTVVMADSNNVKVEVPRGPQSRTLTISTRSTGCILSTTIQLPTDTNSVITADLQTSTLGCPGTLIDTIEVASFSGGIAPYSVKWFDVTNNRFLFPQLSSDSTTITNRPQGEYRLIITDANQCTDTVTRELVRPMRTEIALRSLNDVAIEDALCFGGTGRISLSDTALYGGWTMDKAGTQDTLINILDYDYAWVNAAGDTVGTDTFLVAPVGRYSLRVSFGDTCPDELQTGLIFEIGGPTNPLRVNGQTILQQPSGCNTSVPNNGSFSFTFQGGSLNGDRSVVITPGPTDSIQDPWLAFAHITVEEESNPVTQPNVFTTVGTTVNLGNQSVADANGNDSVNIPFVSSDSLVYRIRLDSMPPGAYTITLNDDATGCPDTTFTVNLIASPGALATVGVQSVDSVSCFGLANGDATFQISGPNGPFSYRLVATPFDTLNNSAAFNNLSAGVDTFTLSAAYDSAYTGMGDSIVAGNYIVEIQDANSCNLRSNVVVNEPGELTVDSVNYPRYVCTGADADAELLVNNAQAPFTYSLSQDTSIGGGTGYNVLVDTNSTTNNSLNFTDLAGWLNPTQAPNYRLRIVDAKGCPDTFDFAILENDSLTYSIQSIDSATCATLSNGVFEFTVAGGINTYVAPQTPRYFVDQAPSGIINRVDYNTFRISSLPSDSLTFFIADSLGCTDTLPIRIPSPDTFVTTSVTPVPAASCTVNPDSGSIDVEVSGGSPPYQYTLKRGNIVINGTSMMTSFTINNVRIGTWDTLIVTDNRNCARDSFYNLEILPAQNPTIDSLSFQAESCPDADDGELFVSANSIYALNQFNFSFTDTATNSPVTPPVTANSDTSWFSDQLNSVGARITVTDLSSQCTVDTTIGFDAKPGTVVFNERRVTCVDRSDGFAEAYVMDGAVSAPFIFRWRIGSTVTTVSVNDTISTQDTLFPSSQVSPVRVQVFDKNGCRLTPTPHNFNILDPDTMYSTYNSGASDTSIQCSNSTNGEIVYDLFGGQTPYYLALWRNGQPYRFDTTNMASVTFSNLPVGRYVLQMTDTNGCDSIIPDTVEITSQSDLQPYARVVDTLTCVGGDNASIELSIEGSNGPFSYSFNNASFVSLNPGEDSTGFSNLTAGNYTILVEDQLNCQVLALDTHVTPVLDTIKVTPPQNAGPLSLDSITVNNIICGGDSTGSISVFASGGIQPLSYLLVNVDNISDTLTQVDTNDFDNLPGGIYRVFITDRNGCDTVGPFNQIITAPIAPLDLQATKLSDVTCAGQANASIELQASGGTEPYEVNIGGQNINISTTPLTLSNLDSGQYVWVIRDANNCTDTTDTIDVTAPNTQPLTATASFTNIRCNGQADGSITITANGGTAPISYSIDNGANYVVSQSQFDSLLPGTYRLFVRDANGCEEPAIVNTQTNSNVATIVDAAPQPVLALRNPTHTDVTCFGDSNGTISVSATGGSPMLEYWAIDTTTNDTFTVMGARGDTVTFTGLSGGVYNVLARSANGCQVAGPGEVVVDEPASALAVSATGNNLKCPAGVDGSIDLTVTGGTAPYTTLVSGQPQTFSSANFTVTGLGVGNYTVEVIDANGCNAFSNTVTLTSPTGQPLFAFVDSQRNVSCNGGSDGFVEVRAVGGAQPYTYSLNGVAQGSTDTFGSLAAGKYLIEVQDDNGCVVLPDNDSVEVTQPAPAPAVNITAVTPTTSSCPGLPQGSLTISASGGVAPLQYSINGGAFQTSNVFTNLAAGAYQIVVQGANGCSADTFTQTLNAVGQPLTSSIVGTTNVSCVGGNNGSVTVAVSGGTPPYTIETASDTAVFADTGTVSGLFEGTQTVTVSDANGCSFVTDTFTITEPQSGVPFIAQLVTTPIDCPGDANASITTTVVGGALSYTYRWDDGVTTRDRANLGAGSYTLTVTDSAGCTTSSTAIIQEPDSIDVTNVSIEPVGCSGQTNGSIDITVTGGTPPYSFVWSTGDTTEDLNNLGMGSYDLTITDANGCTSQQFSFNVDMAPPLDVSAIITNVLCLDNPAGAIDLTVSGGTPPYSFNWSNGDTTEDLSNLAAGSYTGTVTDAKGCSASATLPVVDTNALRLSANVTPVDPQTPTLDDGAIDVTVTGGVQPYTFAWNTGDNTEDLGNLIVGDYVLTLTDSNGCSITDTFTVTQGVSVQLSTTADSVDCFGDATGTARVDVTPAGSYTYAWLDANGDTVQGATDSVLTNATAQQYTAVVITAGGDTLTDSVTVIGPASALSVQEGSIDVSCFGGADGSVGVSVSGGYGAASVTWINNPGSGDTLTGLSAGNYVYEVSDGRCVIRDSIDVNEPAQLSLSTTEVSSSCGNPPNGVAAVSVTGGTAPYSFLWNDTAGTTTDTLRNVAAGSYTVTVTDANGCTASDSVVINQGASTQPGISFIGSLNLCEGQDVQLTTDDGLSNYQWFRDGLPINGETNRSLVASEAGDYYVRVTGQCGDVFSDTLTVTVTPNPPTPTITCQANDDSTVTLFSSAPDNNQWLQEIGQQGLVSLVGETDDSLVVDEPGIYAVEVTAGNNCVSRSLSFQVFDQNDSNATNCQVIITSVDERELANVSIYPNPTTGSLAITGEWPVNSTLDVTVMSVTGQAVLNTQVVSAEANQVNVSLDELAAGAYILRVSHDGRSHSARIVKY